MQGARGSVRDVRNLIGGGWEGRDGLKTEPVYNLATGEVITQTPLSTREEVDRAIAKAEEAFIYEGLEGR
jgi:malonate-semialdehyde dehydrogenase (acetylating)/methylmalonate-semialdehyde dehydrogenase